MRCRHVGSAPRERTVLTLALGLLAGGCAGSRPGPAPIFQPSDATATPLQPGDAVRLRFWLEPGLSGDYTVDESGVAVLPLIGPRGVTAEPAAELKRRLQAEYAKEIQNQDVAIALVRRVRVLGAVKEPGLYFVDPTMTLGDVVALAGGITTQGKQGDIKVFHAGREIGSDLRLSDLATRHLTSGDEVVVPERGWFSRNGIVVVGALISATGFIIATAAF
jgi:polysaccharide export outer membrane protein